MNTVVEEAEYMTPPATSNIGSTHGAKQKPG
jgi:hypothetical protein